MEKLLIASTYLPPMAGGAERVVWQVAKKLSSKFEVHILTTGGHGKEFRENVTVHRVSRFPLLTLIYDTVEKPVIRKMLREVSPDIVHSHVALPWGYILRHAQSKRVITCHGSDVFPKTGFPRNFFLNSALERAHNITAPSRWLCTYIERNYGFECRLIPNGIDTGSFRPLENVEKRDNVVLFTGRFNRRKGILDLIDAARALPQYEFWFVGNPKQKESVTIPNLSNIKNFGFVKDIVSLYNQATICAFPSHWENFPLVGLESIACGTPVVATSTGFSEYIENGREGILVKPRDTKSLVSSIRYLMENSDVRRRFHENARKKALQYDWSVIAEQFRALYDY